MTNENRHPAHPVRNLFYILLSLLNIAAFLGFFFALATPTLAYRLLILAVCGVWVAFAFFACLLRPLLQSKRKN